MSAVVDQFCNKLRDRLNTLEERLNGVKADMQSRSQTAENALRGKLDQARTKLQGQAARIEQLRADLKARAQQKITETKEAVSEWKAKREVHKLKARADRAEAYAADAAAFSLATLDEAEEAVLDAVVARVDADTAEKTSSAR